MDSVYEFITKLTVQHKAQCKSPWNAGFKMLSNACCQESLQRPQMSRSRNPGRWEIKLWRPQGLWHSPWPGTSFVWPRAGQNVPGLEHHVGDPNKGGTSKGHTISYKKNKRKFWFHEKEGSKNIGLSALALGRGKRKIIKRPFSPLRIYK